MEVVVRRGAQRDAILFSAGDNQKFDHQGERRTNADKHRAIGMLLEDEEWSKWPNTRIAAHCGVDEGTVRYQRWKLSELSSEMPRTNGVANVRGFDPNGDLTEPGSRVACTMRAQQGPLTSFTREPSVIYMPHFEVGAIVERDGKTRHADLTLDVDTYLQTYRPCSLSLKVNGSQLQSAGGPLLRFADRPQDAPIIHLNGPLSIRLQMENGLLFVPISYDADGPQRRRWYEEHPPKYEERKLVRGEGSSLFAQLGTPGLGRGTFVAVAAGAVPEDVHAVAEIAFPTKDSKKPPIITRVVLKQRC
jgi:hypothetical protein